MGGNEPRGCLAAILSIIGIRLGGPVARRSLLHPIAHESDESANSGPLPYRVRDDFLSPAELSFYRVLEFVVKNRAVICPKVNLGDMFFVTRPNENQAYRNKIDRKHVDFLLCHPQSLTPMLGVELDDKSHSRPDRIERDDFVDRVFREAGLPLLRVPARASYEPNALAAQLAPYVAGDATSPPEPPPIIIAAAAAATPQCPKCGIPMIQRVAGKGRHSGSSFWGCSNFPRCRERA